MFILITSIINDEKLIINSDIISTVNKTPQGITVVFSKNSGGYEVKQTVDEIWEMLKSPTLN